MENHLLKDYTKENLPIVKKDILEVLIRDYKIRSKEGNLIDYINEILENIKITNPVYYSWCKQIYFNFRVSDEEAKKEIYMSEIIGLILGYEILRRQAESNIMEESLIKTA